MKGTKRRNYLVIGRFLFFYKWYVTIWYNGITIMVPMYNGI